MARSVVFLSVYLVVLVGCTGDRPRAAQTLPPAKVKVMRISQERFVSGQEVAGTVQPRQRSIVSAKVAGRVARLNATLGQTVRQGDVLIELEAAETRARREQARAVWQQAETELKRYKNLLARNAVTQQDFDAAEAKERVSRATLAEAETMYGYATITAPFDGVVSQKKTEIGDLASPGVPLLEVVSPGALRLEAEVPEAAVGTIVIGEELPVVIADEEFTGTVAEIGPTADPQSRTFLVKLDLPVHEKLFAGLFGRVRIPWGGEERIMVPASAVTRRGQLEFVFVVRNKLAELRLIRTGRASKGGIEVLAGIESGEEIVVEGAAQLMDGQPLEMVP